MIREDLTKKAKFLKCYLRNTCRLKGGKRVNDKDMWENNTDMFPAEGKTHMKTPKGRAGFMYFRKSENPVSLETEQEEIKPKRKFEFSI